ncbi:uncharacterized protein PV07_03101 [Cladophialophora immunda]|uniref:Peptidase A2 domain-containing protein n=1 Tax=Cladophialophora immunda TaxID=569365 RepID=A0A0D2B1H0_9EURO|nr:uncharacterized protein PV07_03101 [Cladophialophora immunda]KIW31452.1 hypothetical protein PV07_03101 [Cladophialophora immunda]OQV08104.1 hypothetical protein CLAIMM_12424 [Cladophialophora immunda]
MDPVTIAATTLALLRPSSVAIAIEFISKILDPAFDIEVEKVEEDVGFNRAHLQVTGPNGRRGKFLALLDTGADANFIDVDTANLLDAPIKRCSEGLSFDTAEGRTITPIGEITVRFKTATSSVHTQKFYVMEKTRYSIIIGHEFIKEAKWMMRHRDYSVLTLAKQSEASKQQEKARKAQKEEEKKRDRDAVLRDMKKDRTSRDTQSRD